MTLRSAVAGWAPPAATLLFLAGAQAGAQPNGPVEDPTLNFFAFEAALEREITVASKQSERLSDAPSSVTVFTSEEIRRLGIRTVEELLSYVPGFESTRDAEQGDTNRISSRSRGSVASESVLLVIDGQRANDQYSGGSQYLNRFIPVENIKQIEIIRGPGSALYGSNAFLGVINITTFREVSNASVQVGRFNARWASANLSKTLSDWARLSAFVRGFGDEGQKYRSALGAFGPGPTSDPRQGLDATVTAELGKLTLQFRHTQREQGDFLTYGPVQSHTNTENVAQSWLSGHYELAIGKRGKLELGLAYQRNRWASSSLVIPSGVELAPGLTLAEPLMGGPNLRTASARFNADFSYDLHPTNSLLTGVSVEHVEVLEASNFYSHDPFTLDYLGGSYRTYDGSLSFIPEKTHRTIVGIYAQDKQQLFKSLNLTVGVRADVYNDFGTALSPRAALVYHTPIDSTVRLGYGRAFRAPSFLELYDRYNPVDFGNPALRAETVQTYELAYTQRYRAITASAVLFRNELAHLITYGAPVDSPENPNGARGFINLNDIQVSHGLELEVSARATRYLSFRGTLTRLFDAATIPLSPTAASLIANFELGRFNLNLSGTYRQRLARLPSQSAYALFNAAASYRVVSSLRLTAQARNLLNTGFNTISNVLPQGVPNRGRELFAGLSYEL